MKVTVLLFVTVLLLQPLASAYAEELEFLFAPGKAVSLTASEAVLPIGTKFDLNSIKAALPGYDVRFFSAEEQERTDQTLGAEGSGWDAFVVSKNERDLLRVFSYGLDEASKLANPHLRDEYVIRIDGIAGTIDATGSTLGGPLNKAIHRGKVTCYRDSHENAICWSTQLAGIVYVPSQPENCDDNFYSISGEFSAQLIPDCVTIVGIYLH
jgi:hypothetical protein